MCEKCGKHPGKEVHHLMHQSDANNDGIIAYDDVLFHKNKLANLMALCEACHDTIHKQNEKGVKKIKTSNGVQVLSSPSSSRFWPTPAPTT
jgi:5-methylcytosine-specific restriction endonuclease McrA